jgi:hypothetical protein
MKRLLMAAKTDYDIEKNEIGLQKSQKFWKFWVLVLGIMFFFGCHNYMQELIMSLPGFEVFKLPTLQT